MDVTRTHSPAPNAVPPKAARAAQDFEAVFASQVTKLMMESVEIDSDFGGGHGEEMFRGIMAEELGKAVAKQGGLGIASAVSGHLLRLQEKSA